MFFKNILFVLVSLVIVGCGGAQPSPSADSMPKWFLNPPASNPTYYYGVGEGSSKDNAKANALAQVGGKISVNISSNLDVSTTVDNDKVDEVVKSQTKSSIDKIKFTGVEVIENAYASGKFYTYVKVDRGVLFSAQKKAMDIEYNKVLSIFKSAKDNNIFELIKNKSSIEKLSNNVMSKLPILSAINPKFNQSKYLKELSAIKQEIRNSASNAMVYVTDVDSTSYAEVLKNYISTFGMTLVDNPKNVKNKKNLLLVEVKKTAKVKNVKTSDPRLKGASFADVTVTLTTRSSSKKIIAQNRVNIINISKDGYAAAVVKTPKFEREIKQRGILNILLDNVSK